MADAMRSTSLFESRRLQILDAVARTGSISGAARNLEYTVSAISQQVARLPLEREVGSQLLVRTSRGATLTPAGRILAAHADEIRIGAARVHARLRAIDALEEGQVRIGSVASFTATGLPNLMRTIRSQHPGLSLRVGSAKRHMILQMLLEYEIDSAIIWHYTGEPVPEINGLTMHPLFEDKISIALPASHSLHGQEIIAIDQIAKDDIIVPRHEFLMNHLRKTAGAQNLRLLESNDYQEAQGLAAGLGVALLPGVLTRAHRDGIVIRQSRAAELPIRHFMAALPPMVEPSPPV